MIVSGDKVLFLDPCQKYLPFRGRRSSLMMLSDIKRCARGLWVRSRIKIVKFDVVCSRYPDHLIPLDGLYGFSIDTDYFNGVRFSS